MFSRRTQWDQSSNRLTQLLEAKRRAGEPVLDLTESNPTRVGLTYAAAEILPALSHPDSLRYDPDPRGLPAARQAVAGVLAQRGVAASIEDIFLTASTSEAYGWLFKLLADGGDSILVPRPSYPLFDFLTRLDEVETRGYPLRWDGDWALDLTALERQVASESRAVVVVSPNNPTGTYLKGGELQGLSELCSRLGLALIGDEVFAEYPHAADATRAGSVLQAQGILSFSLGGLSKLAGLPGLKLGWIVLGGPEALKREARERLELVADTYLSVNIPVQQALGSLLQAGAAIRREILTRTGENLDHLRRAVGGDSPCRVLPCEGGWTAVLQVPAILSEEDWVLSLLSKDCVLVHPGYFFDFPAPAFLILSLLPRAQDFQEGVGRILSRALARSTGA